MKYLILGANGYIGSYIYSRMVIEGIEVIGTGHRRKGVEGLVNFDIRKDCAFDITKAIIDKEKVAIVCISQSNIDRCYENFNQAYEINVDKTKKLVHELAKENFQIIYLSSDNVFDGVDGNYTEESKTNPLNKYGLMKAEMEQYLLKNEPKVCILRLPKVVSIFNHRQNIFTEWLSQIGNGEICCIKRNYISFVCVDDIYHVCLTIAKKKMYGLYNIAGDRPYSRAELARKFFDKLGNVKVNIKECELTEFSFKDKRPLNLSMDNMKFKDKTGYQFTDMDLVIEKFINNHSLFV